MYALRFDELQLLYEQCSHMEDHRGGRGECSLYDRSINRLNFERNRNLSFLFYRTNEFIIFSASYFYNYRFLLFAPVITSLLFFHLLNEFHANKSIEYNLILYLSIIRNTDLCFYSFQYLHCELSFHYLYPAVKNNFYTKRIYFHVAKPHT